MLRRGRLAALLAVSAVLTAACGAGQTEGGSGPVKIGFIASLTGNYTPLGTEGVKGAKLAVKQINEAGGVLGGRQLELLVRNDKTEPDQAVIAYNDLVGEGVAAVGGPQFSNSSLAIIPQTARKQVPLISAAASDEQVNPVRDYAFMAPPTASVVAERLLQYFQAEGMTEMAVAYDTQSAFAQTGWEQMQQKAGEYGIDFVAQEQFQTSTSDFSPVLTHIRDSGAQGLMVWATGSPAVVLTKQFDESGLDMPLVMSHAEASNLYVEPAGKAAEDVIVASTLAVVGRELPDSELKDEVMALAEPFQEQHGYYPPQFAFDGYGAIKLLAAAMEKAGSSDPQQIQQALEGLTLLTPEGEYRYTQDDHSGLRSEDVAIAVVEEGELIPTDWSQQELDRLFSD